MKTKLRSLILALAMCLSLCVPALAEDVQVNRAPFDQDTPALVVQHEPETLDESESGMRVAVPFTIDIPYDGEFHELTRTELSAGGKISFYGTWSSSFARLTVEVIRTDGGYGTMTSIRSGGAGSLNIRQDGAYIIRVKAVATTLSGMIVLTM